MQVGLAGKLEKNLDRAASALFALACAYAGFVSFEPQLPRLLPLAEIGGFAAATYLLCLRILGAVQPKSRKMPIAIFDVRRLEAFDPSELLLTERYEADASEEALLLDDILAEIGPESRVVRLFDAASMPTAGELDARIRHRLTGTPPADASQALHEALAELRRSLR